MKKYLFISMILLSSYYSYCQFEVIEKFDKFDKFSGENIQITTWAMIVDNMVNDINFAISKGTYGYRLHIRMMSANPKYFSIHQGQEFIFKLSNGEEIKLPSLRSDTTCSGCGSVGLFGSMYSGIDMTYQFSNEQIGKLIKNRIESVQVNISKGSINEIVKIKRDERFRYALCLISDNL